ncbi:MAG TPA: glycosyltransferase family 1 protein [Patescibacteria group bacterium]
MARICIDARFYSTGTGVARYIKALLHQLQRLDTENEYTVILKPESMVEWNSQPHPKNWRVKTLDIVHYSVYEQTKLLSYLNKEKFDLVYFTMFNHPIFYRGKRVIMIFDLIMHFYPPRPLWHPRTWAYRYMMWHAAHWAHRVLNDSQSAKDDVIKHLHVPAKKCTVTLLAVEDKFQPEHNVKRFDELKSKFGLTKPFLFYVNAWRPHKGLPELVEAFLEVKKNHDIQLLISGKPNPSFPEVIESVTHGQAQTSDIITPGFISDEDVISLYSMAEAYINPSHYEGFGLGPLEAMASGCPVISAKNSSIPEAVGDAGLYYKTGDSHDLAKKIDTLLADKKLKEELRDKGLAHVKTFSFEKMAQQTLMVFDEVLKS